MPIVHFAFGILCVFLWFTMMREKNASRIRQLKNGGWVPFWFASILLPIIAFGQFQLAFPGAF